MTWTSFAGRTRSDPPPPTPPWPCLAARTSLPVTSAPNVTHFFLSLTLSSSVCLSVSLSVFLCLCLSLPLPPSLLVYLPTPFSKVVEDGYEFFARRQLVTLFSAPNYCGDYDNAGGMMTIDENLMCSFQVRTPSARSSPSNSVSLSRFLFERMS